MVLIGTDKRYIVLRWSTKDRDLSSRRMAQSDAIEGTSDGGRGYGTLGQGTLREGTNHIKKII